MAINPKYFTRRQQINFENNKDYIKLGLIVLLLIIILILGVSSCVNRRKAANAPDITDKVTERVTGREPISVTSYPRLVNSEHLLGEDYVPPQLTRLYGIPDGVDVKLNFDAATAFTKLYEAMLADGLGIIPLSGYRNYEEQVAIYNYNLELHVTEGMSVSDSEAYTKMYVALPGSSEHQYGRSIDVTIDGTTDHDFHHTEQGIWLNDNAYKFGFIIRYPLDKVDITDIA